MATKGLTDDGVQNTSSSESSATSLHETEEKPTVAEIYPFDSMVDAQLLFNSMKGLGTREKSIIDLLSRRSNSQRGAIATAYKSLYGKDIIIAMKGELKIVFGGHFEDVLVALFKAYGAYDAEQIHQAITAPIIDTDMVMNILCSRNNEELDKIQKAYHTLYDKEIISDISGSLRASPFFKEFLIAMFAGRRDLDLEAQENKLENAVHAVDQAKWDARALYDAGPNKWVSDNTFIPMFTERSIVHLRAVFEELEKLLDSDLEGVLSKYVRGDTEKYLQKFVKFVKDKHAFFAEILYRSMKGLGTNNKKLIHTIVCRCEKDMENIKCQFQISYKKSLESFITGDTSGNYKNILLALCGYQSQNESFPGPIESDSDSNSDSDSVD